MTATTTWPRPSHPDTVRIVTDVEGDLAQYDEAREAPPGRPYVILNMVASVDGAISVDGVTAPLSSGTDKAIFFHLRELADAVLVGAGTVRAENYGPVQIAAEVQDLRQGRGQQPRPPLVIASRSLSFDWAARAFSTDAPLPILLVPDDADPDRLHTASERADIVAAGTGVVDLAGALGSLRDRGVQVLLCEGGPSLNTELVAADLVDEICLTVAPWLAAASNPTGIVATLPGLPALRLRLAHAFERDDFLYLRYLVDRSASTQA